MTESEKENYEIIPQDFNGTDIEFISIEDEFWITARTLGEGLGYKNPRKSIINIYLRNKDELEDFSTVINLMSAGKLVETRLFNENGSYLTMMFSKQPKAKQFRKWLATVAKNIRKTGSYDIKKAEVGSTDWIIQQLDAMRSMAVKQKETEAKMEAIENKVLTVDTKLIDFEKRYDDEKIITPQTKKKIRDAISEVHTATGTHWGTLYKKIWDHFNISSTTDISEKLGQKIVQWMRTNPPFSVYLNYDPEEF